MENSTGDIVANQTPEVVLDPEEDENPVDETSTVTMSSPVSSDQLEQLTKGPITWSIFNPGVELSPVNRVEIFCDYMDDFNPGVEMLQARG